MRAHACVCVCVYIYIYIYICGRSGPSPWTTPSDHVLLCYITLYKVRLSLYIMCVYIYIYIYIYIYVDHVIYPGVALPFGLFLESNTIDYMCNWQSYYYS